MIRNGRRTLAALLALLMVLVLLPTVSAQADGEIEIATYEQLKAFATRVNGGEVTLNAKLTEDIVCKNSPDDTDYANDWTPIGTYNKPYRGTFDGQGYKIIGLSNADVDYSGLSDRFVYIGLFGRSGGTVENVVLEDCDLSFASDADVYVYMGAVVGRNDGTVKACSVSGKLSAALTISSYDAGIGGVVGYNKNTVKTCTNSGAVSVSGNIPSIHVGGVVGDSGGAEQYCANTGAVSGAGNVMVGGVVGYCNSVKNCFNTGAVSGDDGPTGGIVGSTSFRTVENCLNVGTVTGDSHTGGVIGQNNYGTVKTCLSVGAVSGSGRYIGGVVGMCPNNASVKSYVENCYCLDTAADAPIGSVGTAVVTSVSGLTAEQLKSIENCAGFSTEGGWYEGLYYPVQTYFAAAIHLYANSNEDLVIASYLPAFVPTKIANPFTYADHDFTGWNTDPDGDGDPYSEDDAFTLQPGEALTLHAQWRDSVVNYPLWVGGVQVTSANADDVLNDGGTVKFEVTDEGENVLTLDNANIMGVYSKDGRSSFIRTDQSELTILLVGENTLVSSDGVTDAIFNPNGSLTIGGEGSLSVSAIVAILAIKDITITGGKVIANSTSLLNHCVSAFQGKITVNGGKLIASCSADSRDYVGAICANTGIEIGEGMAVTAPVGGVPGVKYGAWFVLKDGEIAKTVVIEPAYTITFQNEDGTPLQSGPVAAGETPVYEGDTPTKAPTVEHLYTFAGWKLLGTETVLTQLPEVTGEATYVAAYTESDRVYTGPIWAWDGYESATATFTATDDTTFTQVLTATGDAITNAVTTQPTCTEKGERTYTATVTFLGQTYTNDKTEPIDETGHAWSEPTYTWDAIPGGYTCTAYTVCANDPEHEIAETVTAVYGVVTEPTLFEEGLGRYTATFEDGHFTEQTKDVPIAAAAFGFYGEDVNAFDVAEYTEDGTLYRYDIRLKTVEETLTFVSAQMFLAYDADALTFVEAKTALPGSLTTRDENGVFSLAWANDEGIEMENGAVVISLYFRLDGTVQDGDVLAFPFTDVTGFQNTAAYLDNGVVTEAESFDTADGSITFAVPTLSIAGEDVLSGDIYAIENGKILYRYDLRMKDLPEAGLWINSAQIFVEFDHAILALARTEGAFDWTVTENGDKLMAVWASDEDVQINEDDVVLTLWFEKIGEAPEDGRVPIVFTTNLLGNTSAVSIAFFGTVTELETNTVDGSITFEEVVYGDANCDGVVTSADAALILRAIVGLSELSMRGALNADVDGDMEVTAADAALILRYVVGLIDSLPAEP